MSGNKDQENFGKFQSAEALLKAYQSLEKEFTRRSQKLRELQKAEKTKTENVEESNIQSGYCRTKVLACKPKDREI